MVPRGRATGPQPPQDRLRLISHYPGRLRVRAETFRVLPEVAEEVSQRLLEEEGVKDVSSSTITGSLLVVYDPRQLQLPRIIQLLIRVGGLHGLEVDAANDFLAASEGGTRVREAFDGANESLRGVTRGHVDMKVALPGALAGLGVGMLLAGRFVMPFWYDFMFWSFVTFQNLNPREASAVRRSEENGEREDDEPGR